MAKADRRSLDRRAPLAAAHVHNIHGGNGVSMEYQLASYFFIVRILNMGLVSKE